MPEQVLLERTLENLARLKLPRIREAMSEVVKAVEKDGWSYLTLLDTLFG